MLDRANHRGFQEDFQEEVVMRVIISLEAEVLVDPSWRKSSGGCPRVWVKLPQPLWWYSQTIAAPRQVC